ncbi:MAG: 50S ribosomal protein L13 [Bryobacteraceae bacterium]
MKTVFPSKSKIERSWFVLDASTAPLGRLASQAARILMGKNKPIFTPFLDTGDHVIVVNADRAVLTGNKENQKVYHRHSGYPGGLRVDKATEVRAVRPVRLVEEAIRGMLPKTKLGKQMYRKLKVYAGDKHPHDAQQPQTLAATSAR